MSNRALVVTIAASAAVVAAAIVWTGSGIERALREPHAGAARPLPEPRSPAAPPDRPATPVAPPPAAGRPEEATVQLGVDSFTAAFAGKPARRAERECWSKAPEGAPDALGYRLGVDGTGTVVAAEPQYGGERAEAAYGPLYECVANIIRSMRFDGVTRPVELLVQADRPKR